MVRRRFLGLVSVGLVMLSSSVAFADLTVRRGQFTDRVERMLPVGDAAAASAARRAVYWIELANTGEPTTVTLVWSLDGREVGRQTLDAGRGRRWRTWGSWRLGRARSVAIEVLDATGRSLHRDTATLSTSP